MDTTKDEPSDDYKECPKCHYHVLKSVRWCSQCMYDFDRDLEDDEPLDSLSI